MTDARHKIPVRIARRMVAAGNLTVDQFEQTYGTAYSRWAGWYPAKPRRMRRPA